MTEEERRRRNERLPLIFRPGINVIHKGNVWYTGDKQKAATNLGRYNTARYKVKNGLPEVREKPKQSIFNKFSDLLDANTDADKYRRLLNQEPEDYAQQQKNRGVGRVANNPWQRATNTGRAAYEGFTEAPRKIGVGLARGTEQQAKADQSTLDYQRTRDDVLLKAQRRLLDPSTPLDEKQRWYNYLKSEYPKAQIEDRETRQQLEQNVKDTDQTAALAAIAEMGFDIATLGVGSVTFKGAKAAAKAGTKELLEFLVKNGVKPIATGATAGGIGAVTTQGSDVTAKDIAIGATAGGTLAAGFPLVGAGVGRLTRKIKGTDKLFRELAEETDEAVIKTTLKNASKDIDDSIVDGLAPVLAKETDTKVIKAIVDGVSDSTSMVPRQVADSLAKSKDKTEIRNFLDEAMPTLDEVSKIELTNKLHKATSAETVQNSIEEAAEKAQKLSQETAEQIPDPAKGMPNEQLAEEVADIDPSAQVNIGRQVDDGVTSVTKDIGQAKVDRVAENIDSGINTKLDTGDTTKVGGLEKYNPDRIVRKLTTLGGRLFDAAASKGNKSQNVITRNTVRAAQGVGRNVGKTEADKRAARMFRGKSQLGKVLGRDLADAGADFNEDSLVRVWATLDTERASQLNLATKISDLDDSELALRQSIKQIVDEVTDGNLQRGFIDEKVAKNQNYLFRDYLGIEEANLGKEYRDGRSALLAPFKKRKDVGDDLLGDTIKDPTYLMGTKVAKSYQAWALHDYATYLKSSGITSPKKLKGYEQLPTSKLYGEAAGEWVPKSIFEDFNGFTYNNQILEKWNGFASQYDKWKPRQYKKQMLTIYNPAVRLGNQVSNRFIFSTLNGLSPIKFNRLMHKSKSMVKNKHPLYLEAVEEGLTGTDITKADFLKNISESVNDPNIVKEAGNWFQKTYSGADDRARLVAYVMRREQGYSRAEAARLTQRGFQDYASVGFMYDLAAKTPVFGNAFVRFAGDYARILKNQIVDNPIKLAGALSMIGVLSNVASGASGESEDDRSTREGRFGAPSIPLTAGLNKLIGGPDRNISLEFQTPWGAVNAARFIPGYSLNEISNGVTKLLPFSESPIERGEDGGFKINPASFNDPLLGQFAQLGIDQDFRGKSIQDPENYGQFRDDLPQNEKNKNIARFLFTNNVPLGREADSVVSAATGQEDAYGKTRSLPQSLFRAGGLKVQQYGPEQAQEQRSRDEYFDEKERIDTLARELPQEDQEAFRRLTGYYKKRERTENEFKPGTERYVRDDIYNFPEDKWAEYVNRPELYEFIKNKKIADNQRQGTPIQPEFDERLSLSFRKQLIANKSLVPGEDVEADERLYSHPEYDYYSDIKEEYNKEAAKYYPQNDDEEFIDEMVKHKSAKFPKKGAAYQAYSDAYKLYADEQGPKPEWSDQVEAERDAYNEAKRVWTNKERVARGLPEIPKEVWDNVTFGFQEDEEKAYNQLKYGKGYGGYGYGSGGGSDDEADARTYVGKLLSGMGSTLTPPKVNAVAKTPTLRYKKPFKGSKPKVRFRFK